MTIDLLLTRFHQGAPAPADRAVVRRAIADIRGYFREDYWQKGYDGQVYLADMPDGGRMEIQVPPEENFNGVNFRCFVLSRNMVELIYSVACAGDLVVIKPQSKDKPSDPLAIVVAADQSRHVPAGQYGSAAFAASAEQLGECLGISQGRWAGDGDEAVNQEGKVADHDRLDDIKPFFELVARVLSEQRKTALWESLAAMHPRLGHKQALHEVLATLDPNIGSIYLQVDIKDDSEVVWQANQLAAAHGITDKFLWQRNEGMASSQVYNALLAFDQWLKLRGASFVVWNHSQKNRPCDGFNGFIAANGELGEFHQRALNAGLNCYPLRPVVSCSSGFGLIEVLPVGETLEKSIKALLVANPAQLKPYLVVSASWCEPCREFCEVLYDPAFSAILSGRLLLVVDHDLWSDELASLNIQPRSIPFIAELGQDGKYGGKAIDGNAWEQPTVANVLRALEPFFS